MKFFKTTLNDCFIIEPDFFGDERGYFSPFFVINELNKKRIDFTVMQASRSLSNKGVLRGLHFQKGNSSQAKIVECLHGKVLDVAVDLRKDSLTYGKWVSVILTPENHRQLLIPRGFAHGFVSLEDNTLFQYLVDNVYDPENEDRIMWNDENINVDWQLDKYDISKPILSTKDQNCQSLNEYNERK